VDRKDMILVNDFNDIAEQNQKWVEPAGDGMRLRRVWRTRKPAKAMKLVIERPDLTRTMYVRMQEGRT
jgi:hypothetical protein